MRARDPCAPETQRFGCEDYDTAENKTRKMEWDKRTVKDERESQRRSQRSRQAGAAINFKFLKQLTMGKGMGEGTETTDQLRASWGEERKEGRKRNCRQIKINELFNCCMWRSFFIVELLIWLVK